MVIITSRDCISLLHYSIMFYPMQPKLHCWFLNRVVIRMLYVEAAWLQPSDEQIRRQCTVLTASFPKGLAPRCSSSSLVLGHLLQLAHLPLRTRLANEPEPVEADRLRAIAALLDIDNQRRRLLELDIAQADVGGAVRVPVLGRQRDGLRGLGVVCLAKVQILRPVDVQVDDLGPGHFVLVVLWQRRKLWKAVSASSQPVAMQVPTCRV